MPALAYANDSAHSVAERFAGEAERSEAAKAEDARKREAELKADKERQEAAARRAAEVLKADKEKTEKARRAKARTPEPVRPTADRGKADEDEMLARAKREAEEMQAAEEARILAEQAAAMQRATTELEASRAAEQERAKSDAQRREATRSKEADLARAAQERARLEELAREAAGTQQAEAAARAAEAERAKTDALAREAERVKQAEAAARAQAEAAARVAEERARADALAREAERVKQAEATARAQAEAERMVQVEADRVAAEWTKRAVANRQAMHKLGRVRDIREARLAAQAQRAEAQRIEAERKIAEAQRKVEDEQRAAAPENRRPELAEAPRPERGVERTQGSARETAGRGEIDVRELRLPKLGEREPDRSEPRSADARERASREAGVPDMRVDSGVPGERTVTVLLVMSPGNYGIRRNGPKVADPIMCTVAGCYVSTGPATPARFLPGRKATGVGNTLGGRAGACRQSLGCVFRGIDIAEREGYLQPVDMHVFKHDRRRPQLIDQDSDCRVADGRVSCRRGIYAEDYAMWVIPERMATAVGAAALQRALEEGLAAPRSADLQPRR
jgi:colicin import membrane protein